MDEHVTLLIAFVRELIDLHDELNTPSLFAVIAKMTQAAEKDYPLVNFMLDAFEAIIHQEVQYSIELENLFNDMIAANFTPEELEEIAGGEAE